MKKRAVSAVTAGIFLLLIYWVCMPDYRVYNSHVVLGQDYKETELNIIVYKHYNSEELYKSIETEYKRINGQPTQLTMNLFYFGQDIKKGHNPYRTILIDYNELTYNMN